MALYLQNYATKEVKALPKHKAQEKLKTSNEWFTITKPLWKKLLPIAKVNRD